MVSTAVVTGPFADAEGRLPLPWLAPTLAEALGQPGHALLVVGAAGQGVLALQMTVAQAWLCESDAGSSRPCGHCASCHLVRVGSHPDLSVLLPETLQPLLGWPAAATEVADGAAKRKPSRQIRIDAVRAACDWIVKTNSRGRAKVLVVHPAQAMNPQSANALLKTLEEPPAGARLLLSCDDVQALLPTVRSRCQQLRMPPPETSQALAWLGAQGLPAEAAATLLAACGGRPLEALAMSRGGIDGSAWAALPRAVAQGQASALGGWGLAQAIDALQKLCHDAMRQTVGGEPAFFPPGSVPAGARLERLSELSARLARAARVDEHPFNEALQIEALVARAHAVWARDPASPAPRRPATLAR